MITSPILQSCYNDKTNTPSELVKCCLKKRKKDTDYCYTQCENLRNGDKCRGICDNFKTLGVIGCLAMTPGFNIHNDYYNCAKIQNCKPDIGDRPNTQCVWKNKDLIRLCCEQNNTKDYCKTWETITLDPTSIGIPSDLYPYGRSYISYNENKNSKDRGPWEKTMNEEKTLKKNTGKNNILLYIGGITTGFLILILIYFFNY